MVIRLITRPIWDITTKLLQLQLQESRGKLIFSYFTFQSNSQDYFCWCVSKQAVDKKWEQHWLSSCIWLLRSGILAKRGRAQHRPLLVCGVHHRWDDDIHWSSHQIRRQADHVHCRVIHFVHAMSQVPNYLLCQCSLCKGDVLRAVCKVWQLQQQWLHLQHGSCSWILM